MGKSKKKESKANVNPENLEVGGCGRHRMVSFSHV